MAVYDIGPPPHTYQSVMAAYQVAAGIAPPGPVDPVPTFELYGPWTETNQYLGFTIPNIIMEAVSGSYVFDGGGATAMWLRTTVGATSCTVIGNGLLQIRRYGTHGLFLQGANGAVRGVDVTQNTPTGTFYHVYVSGANNTLEDLTLGSIAASGQVVRGVYNDSVGLVARRVTILDVEITDPAKFLYGIVFTSTSRGGLVEDFTIRSNTSAGRVYPLYLVAPAVPTAGQVGTFRRGQILNNVGPALNYAVYISNGSWRLSNLLMTADTTPTYGIVAGGGFQDPTAGNSWIKNCSTYNISRTSYFINQAAGCVWDAQNNIASTCDTGYYTSVAANIVSGGNTAHACITTEYTALWPVVGNDTIEDPLYVNPVANNLQLQALSPCIDTGAGVPTIRYDLAGMSRPQNGYYDRGAYETAAPSTVVVLGTHLTNGGAGINAHYVSVLDELITTPATSVTFVDDALTTFSFLQGTAGTVTANSDLFSDTAATFWDADVGKYLYIHGAEPENSGFRLITEFINSTTVRAVNVSVPWVAGAGAGPPPTAGGYVTTANPTLVYAVGAPFAATHVGRTLYTHSQTGVANNTGEWVITDWDNPGGTYVSVNNGGLFTDESPIDYALLPAFVADVNSGSILWSLLPSWSFSILRHLGPLDATDGKLLVLEIPALAAGDYYVKVENPGGEVFTFRETVVTV